MSTPLPTSFALLTLVTFFTLSALGAACTRTAPTDPPVARCTRAEERCQYADGKIGLCTPSSESCDGGGDCLTCMSLH